MKKQTKNFIIYICIVIVPVVSISLYFYYNTINKNNLDRNNHALRVASIYQNSWDQLIVETMSSLNILSLSVQSNLNTPEKIEPLLQKVHFQDPRYGGLYLLNSHGKVMTGSDELMENKDLSTREYINEVMKTKGTMISDYQEKLNNGTRVLGVAVPVIDNNQQLKAILVAHLRVDYIINIMKVITPDMKLYLTNSDNRVVMKMNVNDSILPTEDWVTMPMNQLPWTIHVKMANQNNKELAAALGTQFIIILIAAHALFLLIQFILLKRRTKNEKKQNEAQKLKLIGTLAASTAHEIRNPLTGVKGLLQLLREKYSTPEDRYYFEVINTELDRINDIISEFLILGKPSIRKTEEVNIADILQDLRPIIQSEGKIHNVECIWSINNEPILVKVVRDQLKQVILNITKNAFESMEIATQGTITIKLCIFEGVCQLEITDNGKGISKTELKKIFNPFYTSKDTGTGLGLVVCNRIIQSFGGSIHISSTVSVGTTVQIRLPLAN